MQRYAGGDHKAFERLYLKHKGPLYRYFVRQIQDKQLAEDLYQDTWGRVIKAAASYQNSAKFTTWLYTIAHNLLIDHVRALKPVESVENLDELQVQRSQSEVEAASEKQAKSSLLTHCITLLPQVQKEAFLLSIELGLTAAVIAEIVDAGLEATKSRLRYANQSLKTCVQQKWQEQ
ncbi:sigma-70 family RNA polymerase sigma factor [Shewanella sp. AS1]|uniref:sigma-70 family RNA polymerase sigma factor n=1 Tax=Shewanella sp. AS1 TaxID=2907626 RepID=UPI001F1CFE38|nr:sigma-70 family RNA polymerase sigma factor [Shewanella sp. AS1]MCE9679164.1 sigma-70 family RNA polymerase sigma factor [Shewanella sp. AS1]